MIEVLRKTDGWIAVAKPAGLPVVPTREDPEAPTVRSILEDQLGQPLWVVHRLDRDTSGVLVLARTGEAHRRLSGAFEHREVEKLYLAVCTRTDPDAPAAGKIDLALVEGRKGEIRVAPKNPGKQQQAKLKEASTRFRVLFLEGDFAVIEARPATGRRHQIRVHLAAVGWPLAVDPAYGGAEPLVRMGGRCERLTLHAWKLRLPDEEELVCPPPADLAPFLEHAIAAAGG